MKYWPLLGLVFLAGCQDRTYPAPTDKHALVTGTPLAQIPGEWFGGVQKFGDRLAELQMKDALKPGHDLVSPVAAYQTLAILFNGAEGKTYDVLAKLLGAEKVERFDINDAQRAWREAYAKGPESPAMVETGVWLIWPVLVTKKFQEETAENYQADVVKLGSAGMGATDAVNAWAKKHSHGQFETIIDQLKIEDQMITTSMISIKTKWRQPMRESSDGMLVAEAVLVSNEATSVVLTTEGETFYVTLTMPGKRPPVDKGPVTVWLPKLDIRHRTDLRPRIRELGGWSLMTSPNDWRNLSIEFDRQGRLDAMWQDIRLTLGATGLGQAEGVTPETVYPGLMDIRFDQRFFIAIRDRVTGSAIIQGWIDPT